MRRGDDLVGYYRRELSYLREMGREFAARYPKIAARLELATDESPDPHVERLIESFAFLTARLQYNIDAEFPEITSTLLGILYPQMIEPVPSMAIAHFDVDPAQGKLTSGYSVAKNTSLFARANGGLVCRFRTCYPLTLWPVEVEYADFESPDQYPFAGSRVSTVLRLRLRCHGADLSELEWRRLRFFLHGERRVAFELYQLLVQHVDSVVLRSADGSRVVPLSKQALRPVGFGDDEDVLPYPAHAHSAYRLLQEYFAFPDKFLFFDLEGLDAGFKGDTLDILILLDRPPGRRLAVNRDTFRLNCTPIVNLFRKSSEPIRWDHRTTEYRLVPDMRREKSTEIHSILRVSATSDADDGSRVFAPFYAYTHTMEQRGQKAFWHARRRPTGRADLPGTDVYLSFLDLEFNPAQPASQVVYAHTLCTNRRLAEQLSAGALLDIEEGVPRKAITCLTKPTPQGEPALDAAGQWRLISHLALNHLSLSEGRASLNALREILLLYSHSDHDTVKQQINGIVSMSSRRIVRRVGPDAWRGFCRGTEITLTFDEELYVGSSPFLLASVLNRFFALYTSVNSFTQLVIKSRQREGIWYQWQPMAGEQDIL